MSSLEIYKASAGSGKTFTIVREYLELVFRRPSSYRNILAVTFTNKATAEMKDRILKELANLASGKPSGHIDHLRTKFRKSDAEIKHLASFILKSILHDYSRFSVSTIDSFFQRVIRSFSREIRLNASYRTELDTGIVLEEAVDRLFLEIDNNEALRNWMLRYAEEKLSEGKNWNFREELISRGEQLFNEEFKIFGDALLEKLNDKGYLNRYSNLLKEIVEKYENQLIEMGRSGLELISKHGLSVEQFKYGNSSFANHFKKLATRNFDPPGKRALDARDYLESWSKPTDKPELKDSISMVYYAGLNELLCSSIDFMESEGIQANSAKAILANLFSFGLLTDIAMKISEVSNEKNLVLLNDAGQLLSKIIADDDTPFVYEKMGSVYRHFMLDEFQDTSRVQWKNFRPLIGNALSEGNKSIVVGDIKQSIYRWRNGDWDLLANQLERDFSHFDKKSIPLDINWRSSPNVIAFNNALFHSAAKLLNRNFDERLSEAGVVSGELSALKGTIEKAYAGHYQEFSGKVISEGHVLVKFIDNGENRSKGNFRETALEAMISRIEEVQSLGVKPGEIAILVRGKADGAMVAKRIFERKAEMPDSPFCYDVISNDSLFIGHSSVVRFVLNFFRILAGSGDDIIQSELIYTYYRFLLPLTENQSEDGELDIHSIMAKDGMVPELFQKWLGLGENQDFFNGLLALPLYELASRIVDNFSLNRIEGEWAHLQSFLDLVLEYGRNEPGGITGFLDWWELVGKSKTINISDVPNAMRILTIHKSKGLEFHTVIVPFCDWEIIPQGNKVPFLWCHPETSPFNQLDLVLVKFGKNLEKSVFSGDYYRELLYSMVDNLNLLYVAFTRAISSLTVFCPSPESKLNIATNTSALLQNIMETPLFLDSGDRKKYLDLNISWNPENKVFELGQILKPMSAGVNSSALNVSLNNLIFSNNSERLKLRTHSEGYFEFDEGVKSEKRGRGKLIHEIFEKIKSEQDIEPALKRMVIDGKINANEAEEMAPFLHGLISNEPLKGWFSGDWKVLNERGILRGNEERHRPDRVMLKDGKAVVLDYKTGEKSEKDIRQVKGYLADLSRMGFPESKGYIWYLENNEMIDVDQF